MASNNTDRPSDDQGSGEVVAQPEPQEVQGQENPMLEAINPSKQGWEIVIKVDNTQPDASQDLKTFRVFPMLGISQFKYEEATSTVTLSPLEDSAEEQFSDEHIAIIKKHQYEVRQMTAGPETQMASTAASVHDALADQPSIVDRMTMRPQPDDRERIKSLNFEMVIIRLPSNKRGLKGIIKNLRRIAQEEKFEMLVDIAGGWHNVIISKKEEEKYTAPISRKNISFLQRFELIIA